MPCSVQCSLVYCVEFGVCLVVSLTVLKCKHLCMNCSNLICCLTLCVYTNYQWIYRCLFTQKHTHVRMHTHTFILYNFIWKQLLECTGDKVKYCIEEVRSVSNLVLPDLVPELNACLDQQKTKILMTSVYGSPLNTVSLDLAFDSLSITQYEVHLTLCSKRGNSTWHW